jgi:hypothetical protein
MAKNMGTKAQVLNLAKKQNCTIEIDGNYIEAVAPAGKVMGDDNLHYSGYEVGLFAKGEIWRNLYDDMTDIKDCNCGCADN